MKKHSKTTLCSMILCGGGILLLNCLDHIFNNLLYAIILGVSILLCINSIFISICFPVTKSKLLKYGILTVGLIGILIMNLILLNNMLTAVMLSITIIIFLLGIVFMLNFAEKHKQ